MKLSNYYTDLLLENKKKIRDIISSKYGRVQSSSQINDMTNQLYDYFSSFTDDDDLIALMAYYYFNNKTQPKGSDLKELGNTYDTLKKYNLSLPKKLFQYKTDINDSGNFSDELLNDMNDVIEKKKNELKNKNKFTIEKFPPVIKSFLTLNNLILLDKLSLKIKILEDNFDYEKYSIVDSNEKLKELLLIDLKKMI